MEEQIGKGYSEAERHKIVCHNFFLAAKQMITGFVASFLDRYHIDEVEPVSLVVEYVLMEYVRAMGSRFEWTSRLTAHYLPSMTEADLEAQFHGMDTAPVGHGGRQVQGLPPGD